MTKLVSIEIENFRSIENAVLRLPDKKPLVLFGANNAGKSNIIAAINRALGERYAPNIEMLDSDYFMRNKDRYSSCRITCHFNEPYYVDRRGNTYSDIRVSYNADPNLCQYEDLYGNKLYISNSDRERIQAYLVDAERSIGYQLSYSSRYSLLSKFSHAIHDALGQQDKSLLSEAFERIKGVFQSTPEFAQFFSEFDKTVKNSVQGFVHGLEVDFSAYDPNNYAKSMKVFAKEGASVRAFDEFGTGEQQVLLMAFAKSYMQVFGSESVILILEEPEAHLHPLAQRWLKQYVYEMCESGIQIILSTHSADFIDPSNIDGLVRVSKDEDGVTRCVQLSKLELRDQCIADGVGPCKVDELGVGEFYAAKMMPDALKGLFAKRVLLVEGPTEYFALPVYFQRAGLSLAREGIEIVSCGGKGSIPSYYRLFNAFGIECYCLFDADSENRNNSELQSLLGIDAIQYCPDAFVADDKYAYFGKDFETTLRCEVAGYEDFENEARKLYKVSGKPAIAKVAASTCGAIPTFICTLKDKLQASSFFVDDTSRPNELDEYGDYAPIDNGAAPSCEDQWDEDIPF